MFLSHNDLTTFLSVKGYLKLTTYDGKDFGYVGKETTWYGAYTRANHDEEKLIVEINESFDTWGAFNIKTIVRARQTSISSW